jgi:hypothetical protein
MLGRHLEFIKERQYVMNVSPATIRWYTSALKWLDTEAPTQEELTRLVVKMRERGLKATGCNAATRAINAYLHWSSGATGKCGGGCRHPHVKPMREPEFVPTIFTDAQIKKLVRFSGRRFFERRLHLLILILLDTGCRISEATGLRVPYGVVLLPDGHTFEHGFVDGDIVRYIGGKEMLAPADGEDGGRGKLMKVAAADCEKITDPKVAESCRQIIFRS